MTISEKEKNILIENAKFLVDKGYKKDSTEYSVIFSNKINQVKITFAPYSDISEVSLIFISENQLFDIAWIAVVRDNLIVNCNDKLNGAIQLLQYLEENYEKITNYEYCIESRNLVSEYIKKMDE